MRVVEFDDYLTVATPVSTLAFVAFGDGEGDEAAAADAHPWLTPAETRYVRSLATGRRRAAWLAGRLAAKTAIRRLGMECLPIDRIEVLPTASGAPVVSGGLDASGDRIGVSISHTRGLAAAVAFDARRSGALGVDVEVCDQRLDPGLIAFAFDLDEANAITAPADPLERHLRVLRFWTAKEAALKAVHRGLRLPFAAVRLEWTAAATPTRASVQCAPDLRVWFDLQSFEPGGYVGSVAVEAAGALT